MTPVGWMGAAPSHAARAGVFKATIIEKAPLAPEFFFQIGFDRSEMHGRDSFRPQFDQLRQENAMGTEPLVLAVDDEGGILRLLQIELSEQGFRIITATNGDEALRLAEQYRPDIVLLDILMPGTDGVTLMRQFRERWNTPVIFVTAKDRDSDKVRGLHLGADDYVVKPFNPEELGARIRAVLRRGQGMAAERTVRSGDVEVDLAKRIVKKGGEPVAVTRTEWLLLQHLAANAGKVILGRELLVKVWGPEYLDDYQYLRVWVSRLRQKLEADPRNHQIIKTHPGIGYSFQADPEGDDPEEEATSSPSPQAVNV